jgi:hypothetical protein
MGWRSISALLNRGMNIALFKGVRHSEDAEHPTVPHTPVPCSNEKCYVRMPLFDTFVDQPD